VRPALLVTLLVSLLLACPGRPAFAATPVDVALVLVDDVSLSINDDEFALQKQGYEAAFADPRVLAAIHGGKAGAIAVAYVEFASDFQVATVINWTVIHDDASARGFAAALHAAARSARGRTAIGEGMFLALKDLASSGFDAERQVIDVCGDGTSNSGRLPNEARDDAVGRNIVVNGLAIANESAIPFLQRHTHPPGGLAHYYEENVTGGEGSFVLEIHDYGSFGQALLRKLLTEISARPAEATPAG
jgi:hypothetical protein